MMDISRFADQIPNFLLIGIIGYFIKERLRDIEDRLKRIEHRYFHPEPECDHE